MFFTKVTETHTHIIIMNDRNERILDRFPKSYAKDLMNTPSKLFAFFTDLSSKRWISERTAKKFFDAIRKEANVKDESIDWNWLKSNLSTDFNAYPDNQDVEYSEYSGWKLG